MADLPDALWSSLPCRLSATQPVSLAGMDFARDRLLTTQQQRTILPIVTAVSPEEPAAAGIQQDPPPYMPQNAGGSGVDADVPANAVGATAPNGTSVAAHAAVAAGVCATTVSQALNGVAENAMDPDQLKAETAKPSARCASPGGRTGGANTSPLPGASPVSRQDSAFGPGAAAPRLQVQCFVCGKSGHLDCSRPPARNFTYCCVCTSTDHPHEQCPFLELRPMLSAT